MNKNAIISGCGLYRYSLSRCWNPIIIKKGIIERFKIVNWIMLNPSKADANIDDPTIKRCIAFSKKYGFGAMHVYNLFAFRATRPTDLRRYNKPRGFENDKYIRLLSAFNQTTILAWGNHGSFLDRDKEVLEILKGQKLYCLGVTKAGHPKHPLYISKNTELMEFPA